MKAHNQKKIFFKIYKKEIPGVLENVYSNKSCSFKIHAQKMISVFRMCGREQFFLKLTALKGSLIEKDSC